MIVVRLQAKWAILGRMAYDSAEAAYPLITEGFFAAARTGKEGQELPFRGL